MYAPFFGLNKEPFSIAPDPRFLFMSEQHREALAHLLYGLDAGGGFVLLTGEIGAGKTTVFRCFLDQVPAHCTVAYVFNPKLSVAELLQTVCNEFGIAPPAEADSVKAHVDALNTFLLAAHAEGRQAVLVIDEAQALSAGVLEQLRLLTNLETAERKLLQIVLIGQPELREMLAQPNLEQLAQRVIARYHLGALTSGETEQYIRHRLAVAGPNAPLPFAKKALARIHALSKGVPRRINLLADRALLGAYSQGQSQVDRRTVEQAAREAYGDDAVPSAARSWVVLAAGAIVVLGLAGWWASTRKGGGTAPALAAASAPAPRDAVSVAVVASQLAAASTAAASAASASLPAPAVSATAADAAGDAASPGTDTAPLLAAAYPQTGPAWRELALRWSVAIGEGDPCVAVLQAQLACFRSATGGVAVVRQLARPGLVSLRSADGTSVHALLVGLDERQATLQVGARRFVLTPVALAAIWRGEFATLWRTPPGWREGADGATSPQVRAWVEQQLGRVGVDASQPWRERVLAFQRAQGLPADGLAGPMTLMRLAVLAGVDEPRLFGNSR